jgi:hypothetical protein
MRGIGRVSETSDLERIVRRLGRRERVGALIKALGLQPRLDPVPESHWPALGVPSDDGVRALFVAGERGSLQVLLLELRDDPSSTSLARLARSVRNRDLARQYLFLAVGRAYRRLMVACFGLEGELRHLTIERAHVRRTDVEALEEMVAAEGEGGLALAVRYARALDRSRVTRQFFDDFAGRRTRVSAAWSGLPKSAVADRDQLALLVLCRLMFLYFLQRRGHLAGDASYIANLWKRWGRSEASGTFFHRVIEPLFFGALNRRPADRDDAARALGDVPYLNGGLFERHALERRYATLDLPDGVVGDVLLGFFERYRFTTRDAADELLDGAADAGVDPEMLGKVFEGMMVAARRGETGTYYTPAPVVDRLIGGALASYLQSRAGVSAEVAEALARGDRSALERADRGAVARAIRDVRVLDPACGSGAFLLGTLSRLVQLRSALESGHGTELRRDIVGRSLHGVDLQGDAALLCALRLWLALAIEADDRAAAVPPLPNLDRRIRQGDALLDPLDLGDAVGGQKAPDRGAALDSDVRRALRALSPAAGRYLTAEPSEREQLKRELAARERELAGAWLAALDRRIARRIAELRSIAETRDLWGEEVAAAATARQAIPPLEARRAELGNLTAALEEGGTLPFFSFRVHFAGAAEGFDLIVSNPPWVRAHRWPASVGRVVRSRYAVCREPGWRYGAVLARAPIAAGAQVDLSQLFLERSLSLLGPGGVLAMMLPAKTYRSLYGGPARRMLLRDTRIVSIEDHSLDQRSVFQADAFAGAIVASRAEATTSPGGRVRVTIVRRSAQPLRFELAQDELPLFEGDAAAPWLLAPGPVRRALRRMQAAGPPLGTTRGLRVRRGVFTGANDVLLVREAVPKLGDLCRIRAQGFFAERGSTVDSASRYEAIVETSTLRPLLRGSDIGAWSFRLRRHVIWVHGEDGVPAVPGPRLRRYLARHDATLRARSGARRGAPAGAVFRVTNDTLTHKVAWHDLAETLNAVMLPASVRSLGRELPIVPLNTVYFIATSADDEALLLAAYFNSLPVRTFARTIAERAKDARFRFFAWTVAALPLPSDLLVRREAAPLVALSRAAHDAGCLAPEAAEKLDRLVSRTYGLGADDIAALSDYDRWLRGVA